MKPLIGRYIQEVYLQTVKKHTNRDDDIVITETMVENKVCSDLEKKMKVYLDSEYIGIVPYSNETNMFKDGDKIITRVHIDKPKNLDSVPFRFEMKLYKLFGRTFTMEKDFR